MAVSKTRLLITAYELMIVTTHMKRERKSFPKDREKDLTWKMSYEDERQHQRLPELITKTDA